MIIDDQTQPCPALPIRSLALWLLIDRVPGQGSTLATKAGVSIKQRLLSLEKKSQVVRYEVVHGSPGLTAARLTAFNLGWASAGCVAP